MDPGAFEQIVFELAHRQDSGVRRLVAPDGGADTLKPSDSEQPAQVWQAKRYTGSINWDECEGSLKQAAERYEPSMITFVFARDLSEKTEASFQDRLVSVAAKQGIKVSAWTISDLVRLLREHEDLRVRFFGQALEDPIAALTRSIKAGGRLESGDDLLERAKTLAEYTDRIDPNFTYAITSGGPETPAPAWDQLPYLTMVVGDERVRIEIASWPREGAEVNPPTFAFQDSEIGARERINAMKELAMGEQAIIKEGAQIQLTPPKAFPDLAADGGNPQMGEVVLFPSKPVQARMEIKSPGADLAFDLELRSVPPQPGAATAFAGYVGPILLEVSIFLLEKPNVRAGISMHGSFTGDATTTVEAANILMAFNSQTEVSLIAAVLFPASGGISGEFAGKGLTDEELEMVRARLAVAESVLWLEEKTGQELQIPDTCSGEEIAELEQVVQVLKTGVGRTTFQRVEGRIEDPSEIPSLPERVIEEMSPARKPVTAEIFGQTIDLGIGEFDLPALKVVEVVPHGTTARAPARVVLEADGDASIEFRLVCSPSDASAAPS